MHLDLQRQLFMSYPRFFRRPRRVPVSGNHAPIDTWGIECGDGWFELIASLAEHYEIYIGSLVEQGVGKRQWPRAVQIKEKLGLLRCYINNAHRMPPSLMVMKDEVERASRTICESCGAPAELQIASYQRVCCPVCLATKGTPAFEDIDGYMAQLKTVLKARSF